MEIPFYNCCDGFSITIEIRAIPFEMHFRQEANHIILTLNGIAIPVHLKFLRVYFKFISETLPAFTLWCVMCYWCSCGSRKGNKVTSVCGLLESLTFDFFDLNNIRGTNEVWNYKLLSCGDKCLRRPGSYFCQDFLQ